MRDYEIPGLSGRPRFPGHLMATAPTNLAVTPLTPDKAEQVIEAVITSLQNQQRMLSIKVHATKDQTGWDIRIDLPT